MADTKELLSNEILSDVKELHKETISIGYKTYELYLKYPDSSPEAIILKAALDNISAAKALFHCFDLFLANIDTPAADAISAAP